MIKSIFATTRELFETEDAVAEITAALDLEKNLLTNSLGIITCFSEFDDTGVLKAVCDALPFECIGATSCLCAAGPEVDEIILAITVLTSDDCVFRTVEIPVTENYEDSFASVLSELCEKSGEQPKF